MDNGEVNSPASMVSVMTDATTLGTSINVGREAVLSGREVDRRVLTVDFDEMVGSICERALLGRSAKEETSLRSAANFLTR